MIEPKFNVGDLVNPRHIFRGSMYPSIGIVLGTRRVGLLDAEYILAPPDLYREYVYDIFWFDYKLVGQFSQDLLVPIYNI
jgi:hypothetical protein